MLYLLLACCWWYLSYALSLQGKKLRCSLSETKHRLFLGNVPKSWTQDEFRKVIEGVGPGVESIELIKVSFKLSIALTLSYVLIVVSAYLVNNIALDIFRILRIQAEIAVSLLFYITIILVPIIRGRICQMRISSWMATPQLSPGLIQRVDLIILLLLRYIGYIRTT